MSERLGRRALLVGLALSLAIAVVSAAANAGVEMSTGIRYVYDNGTLDQCSTKAKTALQAFLAGATEKTAGSGEWQAYGKPNASGQTTAAATVRCAAVGKGFVVTFTCVVQKPGNAYDADSLCLNIAHNFSGKTVSALATPTPLPSGCSTTNLVGTWVSDNDSKLILTLDINGGLIDPDQVSGNWYLVGKTVTLTYYGNKTLTLSDDGKHMKGSGAAYTRKC